MQAERRRVFRMSAIGAAVLSTLAIVPATLVAGGCQPETGETGGSTGGTSNPSGGSSSGGQATGGAATGGTGSTTRPAGYFLTSDWSVSSVNWKGCVWTGIDSTVSGSDTSITPKDFMAVKNGGPYQVSGRVFNDYNAVAMMGFNLNEAVSGDANQCKYNAAAATQNGPPAITQSDITKYSGIAVGWSAAKAPPTSFRVQIQGVDGATNANHRWCATITDTQGPSYVAWTKFNTKCWDDSGTAYAGQALQALMILVVGDPTAATPFNFCLNALVI